MSFGIILHKGIDIVTKATEEDRNYNFEEAWRLYEHGVECLLCSIQCEALGEDNEKIIRAKCVQYSNRAAIIKEFLEKRKKNSVSSKLNSIVDDFTSLHISPGL